MKLGLVLEGGGAKGAYHMGAYKAMMELGYKPQGVAGTSIGAINGSMIVQGDWKKAWDLWYNISNSMIFDVNEDQLQAIKEGDYSLKNIGYLAEMFVDVVKKRGVDTHKMKQLFSQLVDEERLRNSPMDYGLVTVSLSDFSQMELFKEDIPQGKMLDYIMASANFPAFQRERSDNKVFVDGGVVNNLPLNLLPKKGYDHLIAVRIFGPGFSRKYKNKDVKITYIEPSGSLGSTLDFNKETARENLDMGYYDAIRVLKGYYGKRYCIIPGKKDTYFKKLVKMKEEKILRAASLMGFKSINPRRFLFETIVPRIAEDLGAGPEVSYEEILLMFFEEIAESIGINRYRVYKAQEFTQLVSSEFKAKKIKCSYDLYPTFIRSSSILSGFIKDDFLKTIMAVLVE